MPAYLIVETTAVSNEAMYREYIQKVPQTIEKFKGEYLVRGAPIKVIAGNWNPERLIIVKFESLKTLHAWMNSPEYCKIAPLREQAAQTNAVIVEGI